jgi:hypothetical protein
VAEVPRVVDRGLSKPMTADDEAWYRALTEKLQRREAERSANDELVRQAVATGNFDSLCWVDDDGEEEVSDGGDGVRDGPG